MTHREYTRLGAQVVAVVAQTSEAVRRYVEETGLPFNILIDEIARCAEGVRRLAPVGVFAWNIARPAVFIVDRTGAIRYSFVADRQDEFPSHDVSAATTRAADDRVEKNIVQRPVLALVVWQLTAIVHLAWS